MESDKKSHFITFGEPEQVLSSSLLDNLGVFLNTWDGYYQPPLDRAGLSKLTKCNAHHGSCLKFRQNMLVKFFSSTFLRVAEFRRAALDYLVFGECYFRIHRNNLGQLTRLEHLPALNMRYAGYENGTEKFVYLQPDHQKIEFPAGSVIRALEYDTHQQIYGLPDWLGGLQSILLNEDATLFRRRYYNNGCHLGYILYSNDPGLSQEELDDITEQVKSGRGAGNFRSVFINIPNGDRDAIKIIPIGDISQKDEFERIKNISAEDVIVAHRVRGELSAVMPKHTGSSDIEKVSRVYIENEVMPMAATFTDLNGYFGQATPFVFNFPK